MKLWLKENAVPDGMVGMLEGLFWLLELSEFEQGLPLNDPVIISLMKCHVCIKFDFSGGSKVLEVRCKLNEVQIKTSSTQEKISSTRAKFKAKDVKKTNK